MPKQKTPTLFAVSPSNVPIAFKGQYHYRSGSTKQELKGVALQQFLLKKMGLSWDDMPVPYATIDDIDRSAIDYFLRRSIASERMDEEEQNASTEDVLRNLDLITPEGELKSAAILLPLLGIAHPLRGYAAHRGTGDTAKGITRVDIQFDSTQAVQRPCHPDACL